MSSDTLVVILRYDNSEVTLQFDKEGKETWERIKQSTGLSDGKALRFALALLHTHLRVVSDGGQVFTQRPEQAPEPLELPGTLAEPYPTKPR